MGVETATFISQLSATNPLATDPISEGDDQIRLVKEVLQAQFTSLTAAAVTASAAELNLVDGYTGTTAELNYLDITTLGTSEDSKALTQASSVVTIGSTSGDQVLNIASHDLVDGGLKLAGTLVTASATELNLLDGKSVVGDAVLATDQSWTGSQRGTPQTITQGTLIDLDTGNNFLWTPAAADELSFANETTGQSGFIKLINPSGYTISLGSEVKAVSTFATDVTVAGTYLVTYFSDGTNVYVSASAVLV